MEPSFVGRGIEYREKYDDYVRLLKPRLSDKRFFHSLAVAKEALRLAEKYGADGERAFLAGLLHDICKDIDANKQLQLINEFGIILGGVEKSAPKLWHAICGAAYLERELKLTDAELISAVRYHTTAKPNMTLLESVLYLADFTSEERAYPGVEDMRRAVDLDLDHAMYEALKFTVEDLMQRGQPVHEDTLKAYEQVLATLKIKES